MRCNLAPSDETHAGEVADAARRRFSRRRLIASGITGVGALLLSGCTSAQQTANAGTSATSASASASAPVSSAVAAASSVATSTASQAAAGTTGQTVTSTSAASSAATSSSAVAATGSGGTARRGGVLVVAAQNDLQTFDPHRSTGGSAANDLLYNTLVRWQVQADGTIKAMPELATSWTLSGATATFTLRQGVKFHDGTDFNATVAKYNLDRLGDAKSQGKSFVAAIKSSEVVDPYTLRLNLTGPSAPLLSNLSQGADGRPYMISQAMAEKAGDKYGTSPETTAGTGPMKLVNFVSGSEHTVRRTGSGWQLGADGQPLPYVDSLRVRFIADDSVRLTELRSGNVHVIDNIPATAIPTARQDQTIDVVENIYQKNCYQFTFSTKSPHFTNLQLRQAVQYGINRDAVAKVLGKGIGQAQDNFLLPGILGYNPNLPHYTFDPAKAKQLVTAAGFPNGVDVGIIIINRPADLQQAQVLKQMLGDVGIRVTIGTLERLAWLAQVHSLNFDIGTYQTGVRPDPDSILGVRFQTGSGLNQAGLSDPQIDKLLAEASATYDDKARATAYENVQKRMYDIAWYGTIWNQGLYNGFSKKVQGRVPVQSGFDLRRVWLTA